MGRKKKDITFTAKFKKMITKNFPVITYMELYKEAKMMYHLAKFHIDKIQFIEDYLCGNITQHEFLIKDAIYNITLDELSFFKDNPEELKLTKDRFIEHERELASHMKVLMYPLN